MGKRKLEVVIAGDEKGAVKAFDSTEKRGGKFAEKMKKIAGVATKVAAAGAIAAGAALGAGVLDALDRTNIQSGFESSLGVSPEYAAVLGKAAGDAYTAGFGGSMDEVAAATAAVNESFGDWITDSDLQPLTEQALTLAKAFDVDVNEALMAAGGLLSNGLVADAQEGMDVLAKSLQGVPQAVREEILAATNEYGKHFAALGLSGAEALGLLKSADGVIGVDKLGDALKELTIRGTDMSTASVDAFHAMGLGAGDMSKQLLAGGDTARAGLDKIVDGLLGMDDPVAQSNAAIALFGTPLEDLGTDQIPAFLKSLDHVGTGLGDVAGSAQAMADKMNSGPKATLEKFKRKALGALADFAGEHVIPKLTEFGNWFSTQWPKMVAVAGPVIDNLVAKVGPVLDSLVAHLQGIDWAGVFAKAQEILGPIVEAVAELAVQVAAFAVEMWPKLVAAFEAAQPTLLAILDGLIAGVGFLTDNMDTLVPVLAAAAAAFGAFTVTKTVVEGFNNVVDAGKTVADTVGKASGKVKGFFAPGGGKDTVSLRLMQVKDGATKAATALKSGATAALAWSKAGLASAATWVKATAATVANKVATVASTVATKAAAAGQWLLNAAMNANPIMIVVLAIGALVAAFVVAYKNVGWFRDAVDAMGRGIVTAIGWVKDVFVGAFNWVRDNWPLLLAILTGPIGMAVLAIVKNWDTITAGFTAVKDWIGAKVGEVVGFITGIPGRIATTVATMWSGITAAWDAAQTWVGNGVVTLVGWFTGLPTTISNAIGGVVDAITAPFEMAITWVLDRVDQAVGLVNDTLDKIKGAATLDTSIISTQLQAAGIQRHHTGGTFIASTPGGEGLALLRDRERVLTPTQRGSQAATHARGGDTYVENHFHVAGSVIAERDLIDLVVTGARKRAGLNGGSAGL